MSSPLGEKNRWSVGFSDQSEPFSGPTGAVPRRFGGINGLFRDSPIQPGTSPDGPGVSTACPVLQRTNGRPGRTGGVPRRFGGVYGLPVGGKGRLGGFNGRFGRFLRQFEGVSRRTGGGLRTVRWRLPNTLSSRGYLLSVDNTIRRLLVGASWA